MSCLVVALNPSVDVEWQVDRVLWEEKNVVQSERRWPGGKGVNVARWLKFLGSKSTLLLPLGGDTGKEMDAALRRERIKLQVVPISAPTRANVIVSSSQGQMRFNPMGPVISQREWRTMVRQVEVGLSGKKLLILSGSLPRGMPADAYRQLLEIAQRRKVCAILDCDGTAFQLALSAKPFLVKPNEFELFQWAGRKAGSDQALTGLALKLSAVTGGWVLVSRGAKGGILVHAGRGDSFSVKATPVKPRNTVGAGDAMLAAVAREIEKGGKPFDWLCKGVTAGTAATQCKAGELPSAEHFAS